MFRRVAILLFFIVVAVKGATAQDIEYGVKFDSTHMLIGDQQNLTYIVKSQIPLNIIFPYYGFRLFVATNVKRKPYICNN